MRLNWIDTADDLANFCKSIGKKPLAVDTESDHFHAYNAQVCLIQLATEEAAALVDPLALEAHEMAPLFEILEDQEVCKVLHAARNDIIEMDRDYGVGLNNLFDTQIAARFLNYERNSLNWMLEELIGVDTGDQYQRYDWTTRPLPEEVQRYAGDDVRHLLELRQRFTEELKEEGWFEAFNQQCTYVAGASVHRSKEFDPEKWRKLRGADRLNGRDRAALAALFKYRHQLCEELNQSAVTFFPNAALMRLVKYKPTDLGQMANIKGMPQALVDDHGQGIIDVIAASKADPIPPEELPDDERDRRPRPSEAERARYNALRKWRNQKADQLQIPSPFIGTNATFGELAAAAPGTVDELLRIDGILPWHCELFGDDLLAICRGS